MHSRVDQLHTEDPAQDFAEVDTSLKNSALRSVILGYKISSLALSSLTNCELPYTRNKHAEIGPKRHAELKPDTSLLLETDSGSQHYVDIYGEEFLVDESNTMTPLVMIMPLSLPHNKGFQAPVIDQVQQYARSQERPVLVMSSEGFAGKQASLKQIIELSFEQMADNVHDILDKLEIEMNIDIPTIHATGGSRGGTLSLMIGASDTRERRERYGKKQRQVVGVVAVAPAGLRPLNSVSKKFKVAKQFVVNEPLHVIRKASSLEPEDLQDYTKTLLESAPNRSCLLSVGRTALLFLQRTPLENIGQRLDLDCKVRILTLKSDGITTPKYWADEFSNFSDASIVTLPGHHMSIDSTRKVARNIVEHLRADCLERQA
jgi:hypothetical protein